MCLGRNEESVKEIEGEGHEIITFNNHRVEENMEDYAVSF